MRRYSITLILTCLAILVGTAVVGCSMSGSSTVQGASAATRDFSKADLNATNVSAALKTHVQGLDDIAIGQPVVDGHVIVQWIPQTLTASQVANMAPAMASKVEALLFSNPAVKSVTFEAAENGAVVFNVTKHR